MAIRECTGADLPAVTKLLAELSSHLGEEQPITPDTIARQFDAMAKQPDMYGVYVYDDSQDGVCAFLAIVFYRSLFHRTGTALITELVVHEGRRGTGIGAQLVAGAFEEALRRGFDEIEVGVLRENPRAAAFYRRNGFDQEYILLGLELTGAARGGSRPG